MDPKLLDVTVQNRDGIIFQGLCRSVSSYNKVGKFDVLGSHANFITLVEKEIIVSPNVGEDRTLKIESGVCKVRGNKVNVFLGVREQLDKKG